MVSIDIFRFQRLGILLYPSSSAQNLCLIQASTLFPESSSSTHSLLSIENITFAFSLRILLIRSYGLV